MARPRAFAESDVLDRAIQSFWKRGYEATSMRALEVGTGLKAASLYNAFGDKRALFRAALERYVAETLHARIRHLEATLAPRARIRQFVAAVIERSLSDPDHKGCLLINSAVEVAPHDPELGAYIAGCLGEIEAFFRRALDQAGAQGDLPPDLSPGDTARALLALLFGLRVMARAKPDRDLLECAARPLLSLLGPGD